MPIKIMEIDKEQGLDSILKCIPASLYHSLFQNLRLVSGIMTVEDALKVEFLNDAKANLVQARDDDTGYMSGASWWKFHCSTELRDNINGDTKSTQCGELSSSGFTSRDMENTLTRPTMMPHVCKYLRALVRC